MRAWARAWAIGLVAAGCGLAAASAHGLTITEYPITQNSYSYPGYITAGPDGNLWFTDDGCSGYPGQCAIGRVTTSGVITEFQDSRLEGGAVPNGIVAGPDCSLWFTEDNPGAIGRITASGSITDFTAGLPAGSDPYGGIAVGPDGNLWFVDDGDPSTGDPPAIGRITPSGTITEFSTGLYGGAKPIDIVAGSDGNLWFTDDGYPHAAIGRITTGGVITEFTNGLPDGSSPQHITEGADGNVWFSDQSDPNAIGKVTAAGAITEYPRPQGSGPWMLTPGPDGNVWFSDPGAPPAIGEITPAGAVTEYSSGLPNGGLPNGITWGPDGNIWFTDYGTHAIGRALLGGKPAPTPACSTSGGGGSAGAAGASGNGGSSGAPPKLSISGLRQSHRTWREHGKASRHAPPLGTTFSFDLDAAATVNLLFTQHAPGRLVKRRCVAPSRRNHHDRGCSRTVARGSLKVAGKVGLNTIHFSGRAGHTTLKGGSYTLMISAASRAAHSATEQLRFTIVR